MRCLAFSLLLCLVPLATAQGPALEYARPGPIAVASKNLDWNDFKRSREVPVKVYFPKTGKGPFPVVLFSHGLGGSREGYSFLGNHWASRGYVVVHLQHLGSDEAVWKKAKNPIGALREAAREPMNAINRPRDVHFALDRLAALNKDDADLKGRLDLTKVGMAGHSFGAYTTLAAIGQVFRTNIGEHSFTEPRIKAAIVLSPTPGNARTPPAKAFGSIKVPALHMTGTRDDGMAVVETRAADRRIPFDHSKGADTYLSIFQDGDHMLFSGRARLGGANPNDALFHDLIRAATTAFLDAYLKGDGKAKAWLADGGYAAALGKRGTFEKRLRK